MGPHLFAPWKFLVLTVPLNRFTSSIVFKGIHFIRKNLFYLFFKGRCTRISNQKWICLFLLLCKFLPVGYIYNEYYFSDSVVRHLIKITTKTEEMVPIKNSKPTFPHPSLSSEADHTEYSPTGFGQLPEPCVPSKRSYFHSSHLLTSLLTVALVLCLIGVIYLLIFVTLTFSD